MNSSARSVGLNLKAKLFRGLSDPSRLAILDALRDGAKTVTEIVEATGLSQSNTSNHLGCLRDCNLVHREQKGSYVYYQLSDDRVALLLHVCDEFLVDMAKGIYECTRYNLSEETPDEGEAPYDC